MECECGGRKIPQDGFWVCTTCGDCGDEDDHDLHYDNEPTILPDIVTKNHWFHNKMAQKLKKKYLTGQDDSIYHAINRIIYRVTLSEEMRAVIKEEIIKTNPKNLTDVLRSFLIIVKKNNYPVTNTQLRNVALSTKIGKEVLNSLKSELRDYDWYITKFLSGFEFIKGELLQITFLKVKELYDAIADKLQGFNPIKCINSLCCIVINEDFKDVKRSLRKIELFEVSFITKQKYKKLIDDL